MSHSTVMRAPSVAAVIVTRPQADAVRWVDALRQRGFAAEALPLIDIAPASDPAPVKAAWQAIHKYKALMFVSGNAAEHFFALRPACLASSATHPNGLQAAAAANDAPVSPGKRLVARCWATGPGTLAALRQAGLEAASIDAPGVHSGQFDSEALWQVVGPTVTAGDRVLVVRGGAPGGASAGRNWFAEQLVAHGAEVDFVVAYERHLPRWSTGQLERARSATQDGSVWLLSSSEAIGHLRHTLPEAALAGARAVATHPRIARAAREAGFGVVCESRPTLDDVAASIESLA
ncbi:MAG: hypothetical protein JWQ88_815 [Rhodoferax sp.]|nr:hypothetical protein [Rhodoferax sp.]